MKSFGLGCSAAICRVPTSILLVIACLLVSPPAAGQEAFRRGDANDDGAVNLADPIFTLNFLFRGGPLPRCEDAVDANDDGRMDIADPVFTINFLFLGGPEPPAPGPFSPDFDPTPDGLSCGGLGAPERVIIFLPGEDSGKGGGVAVALEQVAGGAFDVEVLAVDAAGAVVESRRLPSDFAVALLSPDDPAAGRVEVPPFGALARSNVSFTNLRAGLRTLVPELQNAGDIIGVESSSFVVRPAAPRLVIALLPGQSLVPGSGLSAGGQPDAGRGRAGEPFEGGFARAGEPFNARAIVTDPFFNAVPPGAVPADLALTLRDPGDPAAPASPVPPFSAAAASEVSVAPFLASLDRRLVLETNGPSALELIDSSPFHVYPGPTARIAILLPGQQLASGVAARPDGSPDLGAIVSGTPFGGEEIAADQRFTARAVAVDRHGNWNFRHEVDLDRPDTILLRALDGPTPGSPAVDATNNPAAGRLVLVSGDFGSAFAPGSLVLVDDDAADAFAPKEDARVVSVEPGVSITLERLTRSYTAPRVTLYLEEDLIGMPPEGGDRFPAAQRFGVAVSAIGAATSLASSAENLVLSLGGFPEPPLVREVAVDLSGVSGGAAIAAAIQSQVRAAAAGDRAHGGFTAEFAPAFRRYLLLSGAPAHALASPSSVFASGPAAGALGLERDAEGALSQTAAALTTADLADLGGAEAKLRFAGGIAYFEVRAPAPSVPGWRRALAAFRSPDAGAEDAALSAPFAVALPPLEVSRATLLGDGQGNITQAEVAFNVAVDLSNLPPPGRFHLAGGPLRVDGAEISPAPGDRTISVRFGRGIPTTGIQDLALLIEPGTLLAPVFRGIALPAADLGPLAIDERSRTAGGSPVLVDGAPPVLIATTAIDTDGNGGLDVLRLVFSEPIRFSAGRAVALGRVLDDPGALELDGGATLVIEVDGAFEVAAAARRAGGGLNSVSVLFRRALALDSGGAVDMVSAGSPSGPARFVVRGERGAGRSVRVSGGSAMALLGFDEQTVLAGTDADMPRVEDFLVLSAEGVDLRAGLADSDLRVDGDSLVVHLRSDLPPGTGFTVALLDDLTDSFLSDATGNQAGLVTNVPGIAPGDDPASVVLQVAGTVGGAGALTLSVDPGVVSLDARPSLLSSGSVLGGRWSLLTAAAPSVTFLAPAHRVAVAPDFDLFGSVAFEELVELVALDAGAYRVHLEARLDPLRVPRGLVLTSRSSVERELRMLVEDLPPRAELPASPPVVPPGATIVLDGSASRDPNGEDLAATGGFDWTVTSPSGAVSFLMGPRPVFSSEELGAHRVQLVVRDVAGNASEAATGHVVVSGSGAAGVPAADPGPHRVGRVSEAVVLDARGSDPGGAGAIRFRWDQLEVSSGAVLEEDLFGDMAMPSFVSDYPGPYRFRLVVMDGSGARPSAPRTVDVTITGEDAASPLFVPDARIEQLSPPQGVPVRLFDRVVLSGARSVDDGAVTTFTWRQVGGPRVALSAEGDTLAFRPHLPGTYAFELAVTDDTGLSSFPRRTSLIVLPQGAAAPRVSAGDDQRVTGKPLSLAGTVALDPLVSPASFLWTQVRGPYLALSDPTALNTEAVPVTSGVYEWDLQVVTRAGIFTDAVRVVADLPGQPLPSAVLETGADAGAILLDGSGSSPPGVAFLFEQTLGLRRGLEPRAPDGSVVRFDPAINDTYVFELSVFDPSSGLRSAVVRTGVLVPGAGPRLRFDAQPAAVAVGESFSVTVSVRDELDNPLPGHAGTVTVELRDNSTGAELEGTTSSALVNGVVTFDDLSIRTAGMYTLQATSPGVTPAVSGALTVEAGAAP
jgi:hypothetical protein